jgi:hypothetical protein
MRLHQILLRYRILSIFYIALLIFVISSCEKEKKDPSIVTVSVTSLSNTTFRASAQITERGDYKILNYGFIYFYGTSIPSYISDADKISVGNIVEKDTFSSIINISGDNNAYNTKCSIMAYITNEKGTRYGKPISKDILQLMVGSVTPTYAKEGDTVIISVQNLDLSLQLKVTFNDINATIVSTAQTQLKVIVPAGITTDYYNNGYVEIMIIAGNTNYYITNSFQLAPSAESFEPKSGMWYNDVYVYGSGLYNASLYFDDNLITANGNSSSSISGQIPTTIKEKKFKLYIFSHGEKTEVPGGYFTMDDLEINSLSKLKYVPGEILYLYGEMFCPYNNDNNQMFIGSKTIKSNNSSLTEEQFYLPNDIDENKYLIKITNGIDTVTLSDSISIIKPVITGLTKTSGYPYTDLTILGNNLLVDDNSNLYVSIGTASTLAYSADLDSVSFKVPWLEPGDYSVSINYGYYQAISPVKFTVLAPIIDSLSPSSGAAGSAVIINGAGFSTDYSISVYFGSLNATIMSSTSTKINVIVPTEITSGKWLVRVLINGYQVPSTAEFTVP